MKQVVVLGVGSRLMGDDGIGVYVVEALGKENNLESIRFVIGETDVEYCLREMENADFVIIVDATSMGTIPCSVNLVPLPDILKEISISSSVHDLDLLQAMKQRRCEKNGVLITIKACIVDYALELSPEMKKEFVGIVDEVRAAMNQSLQQVP